MAFVVESKRDMSFQGNSDERGGHLGPGTYEYSPIIKKVQRSNVPFGQKGKRESDVIASTGNNTWTPGPGAYSAEQYHIATGVHNNVVKMTGLSKPAFDSSVRRANPIDEATKRTVASIGPGSYEIQLSNALTSTSQAAKSRAINEIPLNNNRLQRQTGKGASVERNVAYIPQLGCGVKVGPGSYQLDEHIKRKQQKGGPIKDWSRDNTVRFPKAASQSHLDHVGPGQYDLDRIPFTQVSQHQVSNRNASFASDVKRGRTFTGEEQTSKSVDKLARAAYSSPQRLKHENAGSERQQNQSMIDQLRNEENMKMESPGPGHYHGAYERSFFAAPENLAKTDQAFGCLKPRFEDAYTEDFHLQRVRGPGAYHHEKLPIKKQPRKAVGFHSQSKRQLDLGASTTEEVGPATYKLKGIAEEVHTFNKSQAVTQFGFAQKRFHQLSVPEQPGPADYVPDKSLAILNSKNQDLNTAGHSMFLNKESRLPLAKSDNPPVGAYDPNKHRDIAKITINKEGSKKAMMGRAMSNSIVGTIPKQPSAASFAAISEADKVPQHRFAGISHSKNVQKNIQTFVESCRGPGSYENSARDPRIYGASNSVSTAANSKQIYFGRNNSSPLRPKGFVKAGRNMVQSESEGQLMALNQLSHAVKGINSEQMLPSFTSLQAEKLKQRSKGPGPGEYEIDMWRAVGANKSFNLKYL